MAAMMDWTDSHEKLRDFNDIAPPAVFYTCDPQGPDAQGPNCLRYVTTRPYAVLDLRMGYQLSRNWQLALNVNNVFDKRYYLSEETPNAFFWYGEPRNFMLRIDAKY